MRTSLLILLTACATTTQEKAAPELTSRDYAPYAVGAAWTYDVNYLGQRDKQTITVVKEEEGYFVDDQQGRFRHTDQGLRDPARFLIRHPIAEGTEWKAIVSASAVEHYRITSVGQPCESAAGRFNDCLLIESRIRSNDKMTLFAFYTWVRGVGLVKIETEADIAGKGRVPQTSRSMVHYSLTPMKPDDGPTTWTK